MNLGNILGKSPSLANLKIDVVVKFIRFCLLVRPTLQACMLDCSRPPEVLPRRVHLVLSRVLKESLLVIEACWDALKDHIWVTPGEVWASDEEIHLLNQCGLPFEIGMSNAFSDKPLLIHLQAIVICIRPLVFVRPLAVETCATRMRSRH